MPSGLSLFLAGDAIITQPWSHLSDPAFVRLIDEIRAADVGIANLEMLIHEYKGHPQAVSGGTYMAAPPKIANELKWAGIDMVAHANNHTFDYGSIGVLETLENAAKAGLVLAGSGKDLQEARAPRYFPVGSGTVALVATASSFVFFGRASRSRPDMPGRPGLNPLALTSAPVVAVTQRTADRFGALSRLVGYRGGRFQRSSFSLSRIKVQVGPSHGIQLGRRAVVDDLNGNVQAIRLATATANIAVMSLHAHKHDRWLRTFAHRVVDEGAALVFIHGPHRICGIELYKGRPIFYGMGNFVNHKHFIERLPSEHYDALGLGDEASPQDALRMRMADERSLADRSAWEAYGAVLTFDGRKLAQLRLLPLDLGFGKPLPERGWPRYASPERGESIIAKVQHASRSWATRIRYSSEENVGYVDLSRA